MDRKSAPNPSFRGEEFRKYLLSKQKGNGPLFSFLFFCALVSLVFLITVLKPHRLYKRLIVKIFSIKIQISGQYWKLHHFLYLVIGFFSTIFFFLLMQNKQYLPNRLDDYNTKLEKLSNKWTNESQSWLAFLIIICFAAICRNSSLFQSEAECEKEMEQTSKELDDFKFKKKTE